MILDEATADVGLHPSSRGRGDRVLREGRTALLIAHRLQQAVTAEQIVVFADSGYAGAARMRSSCHRRALSRLLAGALAPQSRHRTRPVPPHHRHHPAEETTPPQRPPHKRRRLREHPPRHRQRHHHLHPTLVRVTLGGEGVAAEFPQHPASATEYVRVFFPHGDDPMDVSLPVPAGNWWRHRRGAPEAPMHTPHDQRSAPGRR
ncbi:hypothetical protein JM654_08355 [Microbacterium oxydans]|nr:hypothetical protein [Microbacterium oxydans]